MELIKIICIVLTFFTLHTHTTEKNATPGGGAAPAKISNHQRFLNDDIATALQELKKLEEDMKFLQKEHDHFISLDTNNNAHQKKIDDKLNEIQQEIEQLTQLLDEAFDKVKKNGYN